MSNQISDQFPTDKVRKIAAAMRATMHREDDTCRGTEFLDDMSGHIDALEALLPAPTLADMSEEARLACEWMQCDVEGGETRAVIINPHWECASARVLWPGAFVQEIGWGRVTPRPDLPRMEWPGSEKPDPAPTVTFTYSPNGLSDALPEGWRPAKHEVHGRVMVTNPTPDAGGYIYFVHSDDEFVAGFDWAACLPGELTYIDQGGDTPDTVPESTLAEGSEWDDADALARACRESERSHIVVVDTRGTVGVWDTGLRCWRVSAPHSDFAPYTIIHTGKTADQ